LPRRCGRPVGVGFSAVLPMAAPDSSTAAFIAITSPQVPPSGPPHAAALAPGLRKPASWGERCPGGAWRRGARSALARGRLRGGSFGAAAMADSWFSSAPREWVLVDQQQRRLRWRVVLSLQPGVAPLVVLEKRGKGGRVLHNEQARWCPLSSAAFLHPREQAVGGPIPRWLIERVELLDRDLGAQCSQA
jgi:hypothetical protein